MLDPVYLDADRVRSTEGDGLPYGEFADGSASALSGNLLAVGGTASGLSGLGRTLTASALLRGWQVAVIAPALHGHDFSDFSDRVRLARTGDEAIELVEQLVQQLTHRQRLALLQTSPPEPLLVVVDDADILDQHTDAGLERLLADGPEFGVMLAVLAHGRGSRLDGVRDAETVTLTGRGVATVEGRAARIWYSPMPGFGPSIGTGPA